MKLVIVANIHLVVYLNALSLFFVPFLDNVICVFALILIEWNCKILAVIRIALISRATT